jgi:uncharacterized membrane protein SpoIIM required for sporulation
MLSEYWWVLILLIILLMIFYPKKKIANFKQINKKKLSLNFNPILKNIDLFTQFYIKNN